MVSSGGNVYTGHLLGKHLSSQSVEWASAAFTAQAVVRTPFKVECHPLSLLLLATGAPREVHLHILCEWARVSS